MLFIYEQTTVLETIETMESILDLVVSTKPTEVAVNRTTSILTGIELNELQNEILPSLINFDHL